MSLNESWIAANAWSRRLPVVTHDDDYVDHPWTRGDQGLIDRRTPHAFYELGA